jgi:hypothetical protein
MSTNIKDIYNKIKNNMEVNLTLHTEDQLIQIITNILIDTETNNPIVINGKTIINYKILYFIYKQVIRIQNEEKLLDFIKSTDYIYQIVRNPSGFIILMNINKHKPIIINKMITEVNNSWERNQMINIENNIWMKKDSFFSEITRNATFKTFIPQLTCA